MITKSIHRFGRGTVDCLEGIKILKDSNVRVIFEQEKLDSSEVDSNMMISIIESIYQARMNRKVIISE